MISAALLLCLQTSPVFDVREPAVIGEVMARKLSERFGVKIVTDETLAEVPLIFNVKEVTFEQFREMTGPALSATWKPTNDGWLLTRTKEQTDAEAARTKARRLTAVKKSLSERNVQPVPTQAKLEELAQSIKLAYDEDMIDIAFDNNIVTGELALQSVWDSLGANALANLTIGTRTTYSSDGFAGTKKLSALQSTVKLVNAEYDRTVKEFKRSGAWQRLESTADSFTPDELLSYLGVAKVDRVFVDVAVYFDYIELTLAAYNEKGEETLSHYDSLEPFASEYSEVVGRVSNRPLRFSAESVAVKKALYSMFDGGEEGAQMLAAFMDFVSKFPEKDLLSLDVSDALFALSDALDLPLAGRLSDDLLEELGLLYSEGDDDEPAMLVSVLAWLDQYLTLGVSATDVLTVAPEKPFEFQLTCPRAAMGEYVRANKGNTSLDYSRFPQLFRVPRTVGGTTLSELALVVHGDAEAYWASLPYVVVAWESLSGAQKLQASSAQGLNIAVGSMAPLFRHQLLEDAVSVGRWSNLAQGHVESESVVSPMQDHIMSNIGPGSFDRLAANVRTSQRQLVYMKHDEDEPAELIKPSDLAEWIDYWEEDGKGNGMAGLQKARFSVAPGLAVEIKVMTPTGPIEANETLELNRPKSFTLRFDQLPAQWRNEFQEEMRNRIGGQRLSGTEVVRRSIG